MIEDICPETLNGAPAATVARLACAASWDLRDVTARVQQRVGWTDSEAREAVGEYRKFLILLVLDPELNYGMSERIDEVWHQHILDTQDYAAMCEAIVGGMIHHVQSPPDEVDEAAALATIEAIGRIFRTPVSRLWGRNAHAVAKCCSHIVAYG